MKDFHLLIYVTIILFLFSNCSSPTSEPYGNPPAPGFNLVDSDEKAIELADQVMKASGGRKNWDTARFFSWTFAGGRKHIWDKWKGNVRIESLRDTTTYLLNINSMKGKVKKADKSVDDPELLNMLLKKGKSIWINDSYWLVMPFKMKDDGVTLKYVGQENTQEGRLADVVAMLFKGVGDTPQNKYHIFIDQESHLVTQWAFYQEASQDTANFVMPWNDYQSYGNLLLSGDRNRLQLTDISVRENMPDSLFTSF